MKQPILVVCTAMSFALWTILARISGARGSLMSLGVTAFTFLTIVVWNIYQGGFTLGPDKSNKWLWLLIPAGIINGIGGITYGLLLADKGPHVTSYNALVSILVPIFTFVFATIILKEGIYSKQILGVILTGIGVWLIITSKK